MRVCITIFPIDQVFSRVRILQDNVWRGIHLSEIVCGSTRLFTIAGLFGVDLFDYSAWNDTATGGGRRFEVLG